MGVDAQLSGRQPPGKAMHRVDSPALAGPASREYSPELDEAKSVKRDLRHKILPMAEFAEMCNSWLLSMPTSRDRIIAREFRSPVAGLEIFPCVPCLGRTRSGVSWRHQRGGQRSPVG